LVQLLTDEAGQAGNFTGGSGFGISIHKRAFSLILQGGWDI
jgi:hypothetical protein